MCIWNSCSRGTQSKAWFKRGALREFRCCTMYIRFRRLYVITFSYTCYCSNYHRWAGLRIWIRIILGSRIRILIRVKVGSGSASKSKFMSWRGRSIESRRGPKDQWSKICITLVRNWIQIRSASKWKSRIRIRGSATLPLSTGRANPRHSCA